MGIFGSVTNADPSGISAIVGGASNNMENFLNDAQVKIDGLLNRKYSKDMAEYAYSKDLEMWNLQNEYNSPKSQMERFKAAGLNPHLIYGQGNAGNASTSPKMAQPSGEVTSGKFVFPNIIQMMLDFQLKNKTLDLKEEMLRTQEYKTSIAEEDEYRKFWENVLNLPGWKSESQKKPGGVLSKDYIPTKMYDSQIREAQYRRLEAEIKRIAATKELSQTQNDRLSYVLQIMKDTGVNLDKDPFWMRVIADILGENIGVMKQRFKDAISLRRVL